jgi:4-hydroxybenzoate polyprenyltransferase
MQQVAGPSALARTAPAASLRGHLEICRFDHWFKNVFVLPGIAVALSVDPGRWHPGLVLDAIVGLLAIGIVASSNYVINEVRDAPFDRHHPTKHARPVPSGRVNVPLAYAQWLALGAIGVAIGVSISLPFAATLLALWIMGCLYNLRPFRTKDVAYLDVLSEAVNNPLRMLAGWYIVAPAAIAPASLVLSYWMIGAYFMAMKRFAEYRGFTEASQAAAYRRSFAYYDEASLLVSVMFYASAAMLLLGAFIMRYRFTLILATPFVALVMALYLRMGLEPDSPVQQPERLYRQPAFVASTALCAVVLTLCLFYDVPYLHEWFAPTAPTNLGASP